ncbi:SAM-dependent methyltransferase TehB [Candidatus Arsenophonus nilaparvatae]|uniref:SAM-dependent methyltransferase TehB n=1 Tax=Candidatus Arsenophonus nilaparvatae TaxID=1247023 RepID=UPI0005093C1C|nr:SAM-dependent methyltransferase TehB [Candidatus Arsenophonus nilaparvatae]
MNKLICYKQFAIWHKNTIPLALMERHNTKEGTWAQLTIFRGSLQFVIFGDNGNEQQYHFDVNNQPIQIQPQIWHKIASASDDIECQLSFYCTEDAFFYKKNGLTLPHSEVCALSQITKPCKVLDLGSGRGRNSFFLALQGYAVTAMDINPQHINAIEMVKKSADIRQIKTAIYDINDHALTENYDMIISTVVLMFLQRNKIAKIIEDIQNHTNVGGYNLIVCAVETDNTPYEILPFDSLLAPNELITYYKEWEIIKYNEDPGHLHKTDKFGNRIKLNFATLIARNKLLNEV